MVIMIRGQQNSSEHAHKYEQRMTDYINKLEKTYLLFKFLGNNKTYTIYENNSPKLSKTSVNVHNNYLKIKDDLYIIGLGGRVPILNCQKNVIQNGYPYNLPDYGLDNYIKCDEWNGNDIKKIINNIKKEAGNN